MNALLLALILCAAKPGVYVIPPAPKPNVSVNTQEPVLLVLFTAKWCGPCVSEKEKATLLRAQGRAVRVLDIGDPRWAVYVKRFQVRSVPTWLMCVDGKGRQVRRGPVSYLTLQTWLGKAWARSKTPDKEQRAPPVIRLPATQPRPVYQPQQWSMPSYGCGNPNCRMCYGGGRW